MAAFNDHHTDAATCHPLYCSEHIVADIFLTRTDVFLLLHCLYLLACLLCCHAASPTTPHAHHTKDL